MISFSGAHLLEIRTKSKIKVSDKHRLNIKSVCFTSIILKKHEKNVKPKKTWFLLPV